MLTSKPHSLHPEDGGIKVLRNIGNLAQHYTASQHTRQRPGYKIYIFPNIT